MAVLVGACGDGGSVEERVTTATDTALTPAERCDAIEELAMDGEAAVAPLHALAADPSRRVAQCARKALSKIDDPEAAQALLLVLEDSDPAVAASAAEALGWIGDPIAVRPLARLLASPDPTLVTKALQALGRIGDARSVRAIEKVALRRGATPAEDRAGRKLRWAAVMALGDIGDPAAKDTLVTVLGTDPANSMSAGVALARIFQDDVTPLLPLLDDRRNIALAYALVDVGQKGTEDALVAALDKYGDVDLAEYYLNCGNRKLEKAAMTWAGEHGYEVYTTPGAGGGQWGSGV
jgi:HEAT repeat protein